jgi:hypothetical protein
VNIYRLHGDEHGETHLTQIDLSKLENPAVSDTKVEGLLGIPATTLSVASIVERQTDESLHAAPWRQFLVLLQGQHEITTTSGDHCLLERGDVLFTDDVGTNGHYSRDCGDEHMVMISVRVPDDWVFPST